MIPTPLPSKPRIRGAGFGALICAALFAASPARAQIEEVIVTTQKVAENVLDVPHTISVIDGETIAELGIDSIESFYHSIPGLNYAPIAGDRTGVRLYIRGIGSTDALIGQDSSVSVYRDGIYQSRGQALNLSYSDIERIEVLKGPNGTLYGRNTLGGAINIISRRASADSTYGKVRVGAGSYALRSLDALLNVPFSSSFAVKMAVFSEAQDGWIKNASADPDFSGHDRRGFRFDLAYDNDDNFRLDYSVDRSSADDSGYYYQPMPSDLSAGLNPFFVQSGAYAAFTSSRETSVYGSNRDNKADSALHSLQIEWDYTDRHSVKLLSGLSSSSARSYTNFDNAYNNASLARVLESLTKKSDLSQAQLIALYGQDVDLSAGVRLEDASINYAVSGYNELLAQYQGLIRATGATDLPSYSAIEAIRPYRQSQDGGLVFGRSHELGRPFANDSMSFEFQFTGSNEGGEVRYVAGVYYFDEDTDNAQYASDNDFLEFLSGVDLAWTQKIAAFPRARVTELLTASVANVAGGNTAEAIRDLRTVSELIAPLEQADGNLYLEGGSLSAEHSSQASSTATYGNISYQPTESWDFVFGLRLSFDSRAIDTRRFDGLFDPNTPGALNPDYSHKLDTDFRHINYQLVGRYSPTESSNIYLSLTSSYRAGGFNETYTSTNSADLLFDKEEIRGYELGYKGDLGSSIRLTGSVFLYQLPGLQYAVFNPQNPTQRSTVNTDGEVLGLDVELLYALGSDWSIAVAYANLGRESDSYTNPFSGEIGHPVSIQSPHNSVNFALNGTVPFADLYEMRVRLGVDYNSKVNIVDGISQDGYILARLDFNFVLDAFTVSVWSKNLTDTAYIIDGLPFATGTGTGPDLVIFGQPRTWGINAAYEF